MRYVLLTAILSLPSLAHAAVGYDASSYAEGTTSATASHTFGASANHADICVAVRDSGGAVAAVSSVTVGGNAATFVAGVTNPNNVVRVEKWRYENPSAGSVNVAVTAAASTDRTMVAVLSLTGVDTASPVGSAVTASGTSTNMDVNAIGSASGEIATLCGVARDGTAEVTFSPDATAPTSTERVDQAHSNTVAISIAAYTEAGASPTVNMRVDLSESVQWAAVGVSMRELITTTYRSRGAMFFP